MVARPAVQSPSTVSGCLLGCLAAWLLGCMAACLPFLGISICCLLLFRGISSRRCVLTPDCNASEPDRHRPRAASKLLPSEKRAAKAAAIDEAADGNSADLVVEVAR